MDNTTTPNITFNHIHKRLMVIYPLSDMRRVWKKVRSIWKKETKTELPKRFKLYPQTWQDLNIWVEQKIQNFVLGGGLDIQYINKADLKTQSWDEKIIKTLYPEPDLKVYLGRGRYAYYYDQSKVDELQDGDIFIEYISAKLDKQRKRITKKAMLDRPKFVESQKPKTK
jgi:hypothetical protein